MALLLALALLAEAAQVETPVAGWLRMSGLADPLRSTWFMSVLGLFALNLAFGIMASLSELWSESPSSQPAAHAGDEDASGGKKQMRSELETRLGKEAIVELARRFARQKLGRAPVLTQTEGGFELAAKRGRLNSLLHSLAHLAFGVALAGAWLMRTQGLAARTLVEEGGRARSVELLRGTPPAEWKSVRSQERRSQAQAQGDSKNDPEYFDPGFEIERVAVPETKLRGASLFRFYENGKLAGSATASPGVPMHFHGLWLHLLDYVPGSAQSVTLTATDRSTGADRAFAELSKGQSVDLEDFRFKVAEIQPETDLNGPAVQLEYQEHGRAPERFWIFVDFPDYDFAHRRISRQHFTLRTVRPRSSAELQLGKEPGAVWLWGGLTALALLFWATMARPEERFWIRWTENRSVEPGVHRVELLGWSRRPLLFETRFYDLAHALERRIENAEAPDAHA